MKHQLLHLMVRRTVCIAALLVGFVAEVWSMDEAYRFDLYVGGVKVTSSNATNIKGENIEAYSESVNEGKPMVYYVGSENTLYLYNVRISRTGKNHHAIESNVPYLHIILRGDNELRATDASAVRLNANTDITTTWFDGRRGTTFITGGSEDALYAGKDKDGRSPSITIHAANLTLISKSSAFDAAGDPSLTISRSNVTAICEKDKSGDCYALFDYKSLTIEESAVALTGYTQAIKNLKSLTLGPGMYMEEPSIGFFSSSAATVINSSSNPAQKVVFKMSTVEINSTTFPDENFRNLVLGMACGKDGYLTPNEIADITSMSLYNKNIADLTGIEYFTALKELSCDNNRLTSLDLSKNTALTYLSCMNNGLTTLNVSNNEALQTLYCSGNSLTKLNVSNNPNLQTLYCFANDLTTLNVSNNPGLTRLRCENNQLPTLNLSTSTALAELVCSNNKLTTLIMPNSTALNAVSCYGNKLSGSNVNTLINSLPSSTGAKLYFYKDETSTGNSMTFAQVTAAKAKKWNVQMYDGSDWIDYMGSDVIPINVTNFPDEKFRAYVAQESIDANKDGFLNPQEIADVKLIDVIYSGISDLTGIGIFTALTELYCDGNSLTSLDVSNCKALTYLNCGGNSLTSLDVSQNTALMTLSCGGNSLTSLDVSNCKALTYLNCGGNSLTSLDVSNCTALTELSCSSNSLTSLDVSNNTALTVLYCYGNAIRGAGMTTLVNSLPETEDPRRLYVYDNETPAGNWITFKQVEKAEKKGWIVSEWDGSWVPYAGEKDGDVDGDGKVNEADVQAIEDYIMGRAPEGTDIRLYDVNEDGVVDVADIVDLINIIKG